MTSAPRSVAVVATRLPSIDRRALSQAWYSALHVAEPQSGVGPRKTAQHLPDRAVSAQAPRLPATAAEPIARTALARPFLRAPRPERTTEFAERRGPATELVRRMERALVHHVAAVPGVPVTLTIKAADGRVQILVRNDGGTTRVVALCAPHLRERVDRALAQARFALAASGTHVEAASA